MVYRTIHKRSWGCGRTGVLDTVPSIRPRKAAKLKDTTSIRPLKKSEILHQNLKNVAELPDSRPSNPFPSPEQCDNLSIFVTPCACYLLPGICYLLPDLFFQRWSSAGTQYTVTVTNTHSQLQATPVPSKHQTLRDTLQIIRRHP